MITNKSTIEEIIETYPDSIKYLMDKGIKCLVCGEPVWGTLEESAKSKGFSDEQIQNFVNDINNENF